MSDFGDAVEYAAQPLPKVWRLMVFDVPDRLSGLLARLGFRATKKNPQHWWRLFDPRRPEDREFAEKARAELRAAGLKGKWSQVALPASQTVKAPHSKGFKAHPPKSNREGFGGALNARPIAGSWRRRTRHR